MTPDQKFLGKQVAIQIDRPFVPAPSGKSYTPKQIRALTEFQERFFTSKILV